MVPALFITVDKDNESANKTGRKNWERAELFLGNAAPACCQITPAHSHSLTHTHTRTYTYTLTAPGDGWRERRGEESSREERRGEERRGEERGDGRDAALGAALRSPAAGWPERGAARTGMSPLIRLELTVCRSVRCWRSLWQLVLSLRCCYKHLLWLQSSPLSCIIACTWQLQRR